MDHRPAAAAGSFARHRQVPGGAGAARAGIGGAGSFNGWHALAETLSRTGIGIVALAVVRLGKPAFAALRTCLVAVLLLAQIPIIGRQLLPEALVGVSPQASTRHGPGPAIRARLDRRPHPCRLRVDESLRPPPAVSAPSAGFRSRASSRIRGRHRELIVRRSAGRRAGVWFARHRHLRFPARLGGRTGDRGGVALGSLVRHRRANRRCDDAPAAGRHLGHCLALFGPRVAERSADR